MDEAMEQLTGDVLAAMGHILDAMADMKRMVDKLADVRRVLQAKRVEAVVEVRDPAAGGPGGLDL